MEWIVDHLVWLLGLLLVLIAVVALLSPFEAMGWWSGWSRRHDGDADDELEDGSVPVRSDASHFIVYFTGIAGFSGGSGGRRESDLVAHIAARLPDEAVIVEDVFPYSVTNNPLNGERILSGAWDWIDRKRKSKKTPISIYTGIITVRNIFQVAVSADPRYGPMNNLGVAEEVVRSLRRHGYPPGTAMPVTIVCYSGGGQIAVGCARYLTRALKAPIRVVSLGGVISSDPGLEDVQHLTHVLGSKDIVAPVAGLLFPGRWRWLPHSHWNRAKRQGRINVVDAGPMTHFGRNDYFAHSAKTLEGIPHAEHTATLAAQAILGDDQLGVAPVPPAHRPG